mgnify:CR=1 FL=1
MKETQEPILIDHAGLDREELDQIVKEAGGISKRTYRLSMAGILGVAVAAYFILPARTITETVETRITDVGLISHNQKLTHTIGRLTEEIRTLKEQEVTDAPRFERVRERILNMPTEQLDAYNAHGRTALTHAAESGSLAVVNLLLDRGADVNKPRLAHRNGKIIRFDGGGRSPLMKAIRARHWQVVELLLDHPEIDTSYESHFGETALSALLKLIDEGLELGPSEQRVLERLQM